MTYTNPAPLSSRLFIEADNVALRPELSAYRTFTPDLFFNKNKQVINLLISMCFHSLRTRPSVVEIEVRTQTKETTTTTNRE
jgi:hypothetical protein